MKKSAVTLAVLLVVALGLWILFSHFKPTGALIGGSASGKQQPAPEANSDVQIVAIAKQTKPADDEDAALEATKDATYTREIQQIESALKRQYETSIEFYGLVWDQHNHPVSYAGVQYMNADTADGKWTWKQISTQQDGRFNIHSVHGRYLEVKVSHPDYYAVPESRLDFTYAGNDRGPDFKPDPANPVIFRLRKKGEAAELIHQYDHILFTKEDGHARSFSLIDHTRRRDRPEYVILQGVETSERDKQGKPIRRLEMVVPQGGIQQRTDPFAFIAPSDGYQSRMYFMRPEFGGKLDYFVKFNTGNYGRFTIMGTAGDYLIDSYFNPDNSPNLEHDIDKEITVVPTGKMGVDLLYPAKKTEPKRP